MDRKISVDRSQARSLACIVETVRVHVLCSGNEIVWRLFSVGLNQTRCIVAGILLWLMGVPLIVIILLYLIF